jgi:hypothetical protein
MPLDGVGNIWMPAPGELREGESAFEPQAKVGLWLVEKKRLDGARFTFPRNWYEEFECELGRSPGAERLLTNRFFTCDFRKVGKAAMLYVRSPQDCLYVDRETRARRRTGELRSEARELKGEIKRLSAFSDRSGLALPDGAMHQREQRLIAIQTELRGCSRLLTSRSRRGRGTEGDSGDHGWLFLIREYLTYHSGLRITGAELALIVRAAKAGLGYGRRYRIGLEPSTVLQRLKRFEKNNAEFCTVAKRPVSMSPKYVPGAVHVIDTLPS